MPYGPDIAHFDRIATRYDRHPGQLGCRRADRHVLDAAAHALGRDPGTVVDVGCGTGRLLRAAAARWPDAALHGVDPAPGMVSVCRSAVPDAVVAVAGAEHLPLPDGDAEVVLSTTSFGHWADQRRGLLETRRILAADGVLVLAEHSPPPDWVAAVLRRVTQLPQHHPEDRTRAMLTAAGFSRVITRRVPGGLLMAVARGDQAFRGN